MSSAFFSSALGSGGRGLDVKSKKPRVVEPPTRKFALCSDTSSATAAAPCRSSSLAGLSCSTVTLISVRLHDAHTALRPDVATTVAGPCQQAASAGIFPGAFFAF